MRLHPEVTQEEAATWLKQQVIDDAPAAADDPELDAAVKQIAEAMAAISRVVLPDDLEPMFP